MGLTAAPMVVLVPGHIASRRWSRFVRGWQSRRAGRPGPHGRWLGLPTPRRAQLELHAGEADVALSEGVDLSCDAWQGDDEVYSGAATEHEDQE